jgi:hypothetical protein
MLLTFGLTINAVCVSFSQGNDYLTSYFQNYYPIWPFNPYVTQTPTNNQSSSFAISEDPLFTNSIFNQISGNYQSMVNPEEIYNQSYNYLSVAPDVRDPKLSIQKCLYERKDLDTSKCILLHRDPRLSVSLESCSGYSFPTQLSGVPSTNYLSLYFICFEGS